MLKQLFIATSLVSGSYGADNLSFSEDPHSNSDNNTTVHLSSPPEQGVNNYKNTMAILSDTTVEMSDKNNCILELLTMTNINIRNSYILDETPEDFRNMRLEVNVSIEPPELIEFFQTHKTLILRSMFDLLNDPEKRRIIPVVYFFYFLQRSLITDEVLGMYFSALLNSQFDLLMDSKEITMTIIELARYAKETIHIKALQEFCTKHFYQFHRFGPFISILYAYLAFLDCNNTQKYIHDIQLRLLKSIGESFVQHIHMYGTLWKIKLFTPRSENISIAYCSLLTLKFLSNYQSPRIRAIIHAMELDGELQAIEPWFNQMGFRQERLLLNPTYAIERSLTIGESDMKLANVWIKQEIPGYEKAYQFLIIND